MDLVPKVLNQLYLIHWLKTLVTFIWWIIQKRSGPIFQSMILIVNEMAWWHIYRSVDRYKNIFIMVLFHKLIFSFTLYNSLLFFFHKIWCRVITDILLAEPAAMLLEASTFNFKKIFSLEMIGAPPTELRLL